MAKIVFETGAPLVLPRRLGYGSLFSPNIKEPSGSQPRKLSSDICVLYSIGFLSFCDSHTEVFIILLL